ncbi:MULTISPECIES: undecaprenyl-phosphate galactose phosphotransferase WbaP [Serratia]|jgi:Undecaprenyl-phosphate galactose phosphotransferase WbaP|uniref:Undecaprenyl-phosphate galactose phosphotransferase WbaP n=1 Tax=Serratia liquefaciens TaxID=614 RepID=A0A515CXY0_SERLI|nr:undecaprenyl-phosphate galactose phosphotransferase WbaP [Serratia liquefaciens]MBI6163511.1 undecaprenyl-phosphate galactose phosphotransferase WbaP [Serratia liquefaciens]MBV0841057.1 undecaprenyl-phosphate galactose phosphotransferase WbaP [Serratia liquefaciens]QDL33024.1 undecaprenyl-phosphate galactose phosphotransferase WbaP [Serratia liquefaciens]HCT9095971.1 undecaprenyl-phosphate galactose phosphotransferase WbaP [Serratia liquefaciens]HED2337217.1 undecaprenyl-phosphate galactose
MNNSKGLFDGLIAKFMLALSDIIFLNASVYLAYFIIYNVFGGIDEFIPRDEMAIRGLAQFILSLVCVVWFWVRLRHYTYRKPFWFELKETVRTLLIFAILDLALVAFSKWNFSRYVWFFSWTLIIVLVPLARTITKRLLDKFGLWKKQTIIIGTGKNAFEAYAALQSEEILGFEVSAFVCTDKVCDSSYFGIPVINYEDELWANVNVENTQFIVALEFEQHALRDSWLKRLAKHNCRSVSVIPTLRGVPLYGTEMSFIFSHEVMILRVNNNLAKHSSRFIKRSFDIVGSLLIMCALAPVLLFLAYKVSRDGGKSIYGHQRVGQNGKKFYCLKFRSMVTNSQEVLQQLLENSPEARAEWEKDFKLKDDPRITKIGAFIRKTSLDELPQLWNVFRGEMSLVGPRPIVEAELERYAEEVDYYLMAKPGMTGLWQVSGRNDIDYATRVYFDAWYVKNWALWNDIAILFKTISVVLKRDGAY